jgi:hypothetical protein
MEPDTWMIFYRWVAPVQTRIKIGTERIFFPPAGNPTGTWYFTTVMILDYEHVKMCSFCDINYDLLWLLNFVTQLSQIFVKY